jgi:hypothetical protein
MNQNIFILIFFTTLLSQNLIGQNSEDLRKKNVIKGSMSSAGIINGMMSIDYERSLFDRKFFILNIEGTYGKYYQTYTDEAFQSLPGFHSFTSSIIGIFGKKSNFFEFDLGVRYSIVEERYSKSINSFFPVGNIGYRYQNPFGKGLVFRGFIGTVGIGISIGKAF